jgi:eukaryotic-like serine/threonine-protein kinase
MQAPVELGDVVDQKYRVDAVLGSGAMSVVVLAFHLELEQQVAIKFLHAQGLDPEQTAQRFKREARAAARIQSEHVVRVFDVGALPGGCPYIVMEHLRGNDLGRELAARGRLPVAEVTGYMLEACEALAEAHAAGVVHRDLKPENLFLAERAGGRTVKLLDFGISKSLMGNSLTDLALTRTATFMGSPLYMSPEQMRSSRNVDARSDIWSLGAIFYEMLSGELPFKAESIPELCLAVIGEEPKSLTELVPELPEGLARVVSRCLEKNRERRYGTVGELALDLAPFARVEPGAPDRIARILALSSASPEARAERSQSVAAGVDVTAPGTASSIDSIAPLSGRAGRTPAGAQLARRRAPAVVVLVAALVTPVWWLSRGETPAPVAVSEPPRAPATAAPPSEPSAAPLLAASAAIVATSDALVVPPPSATAPRKARSTAGGRVARPPASAVERGRAAPPPSGSSPNAWDPAAFGGRY